MSDIENKEEMIQASDIDNLVNILDTFSQGNESRLKIMVEDSDESGQIKKVHHHGRCDIGSPWATGECI